MRATSALQALFRGEDSVAAEAGALMIVELLALIRGFMTGKSGSTGPG